jgi:hypothetical protein
MNETQQIFFLVTVVCFTVVALISVFAWTSKARQKQQAREQLQDKCSFPCPFCQGKMQKGALSERCFWYPAGTGFWRKLFWGQSIPDSGGRCEQCGVIILGRVEEPEVEPEVTESTESATQTAAENEAAEQSAAVPSSLAQLRRFPAPDRPRE